MSLSLVHLAEDTPKPDMSQHHENACSEAEILANDTTTAKCNDMAMEEPLESDASGRIFLPIQTTRHSEGEGEGEAPAQSHGPGGHVKLQHSRSFGDGHGFTCFRDDEREVEGAAATPAQAGERAFEVGWDGDMDPVNPRSMSRLRKWIIVLIVSSSSACVYLSTMSKSRFRAALTDGCIEPALPPCILQHTAS